MGFLNSVSSGIYLVYGLVALLIILIIIIIIIDRKETKRETQNLFDTLNMKIITENNFEPEIIEVKQEPKTKESFNDLVNMSADLNEARDKIKETIKLMDMEDIVNEKENELEKTQAQLRVESITKALEEANVDEKIEEDKYQKFEEEQEKNAIISYEELKDSFDKLYTENEKIQYIDDDTIPININELYELSDEIKKENDEPEEELIEIKKDNLSDTQFRSSPYISPVYGIQHPPITSDLHKTDDEIEDATRFLNNLKELQSNLE